MDDTRSNIIAATFKAVRRYGLDGVRIQNISQLAGLSPGALYRYFSSKDELMIAAFTYVDKQVAAIFEDIPLAPALLKSDPEEAVRAMWLPYFRFWTSRPDVTVFYHRFRDSALFPAYDRMRDISYFGRFDDMVDAFVETYPKMRNLTWDLLWLHTLTATVMYAKYVVEGLLPNTEETENTVFGLMKNGLSQYLS